jgi:glycerol uptake facilitator protein
MTGLYNTKVAPWRQTTLGELLSEFAGTFVLIMFGDGVVAMAVAALNQSGRGDKIFDASGDWLIIGWGWGLAVAFGVYVAGGISGAHLNPAVTIAFAVRRDFPWKKVPGYIAAQTVGAFVGAALVFLVYRDAIGSYESANGIHRGSQDSIATYSIFATFPAKYFGNWVGPFVDQVVGTALLLILICALIDAWNTPPKANLGPFMIGLAVVAIGLSFGANAGYAINPARDFGPRLFALFTGWGDVALPGNYGGVHWYFWVPIVGPIVGGVIGVFFYDWFIKATLKARQGEPAPDLEL